MEGPTVRDANRSLVLQPRLHHLGSGCAWECCHTCIEAHRVSFFVALGGDTGTQICRRQTRAGPIPGLFMFHSMFMNGTFRRADLWFLEYSVFTRTRLEHVYRCSPPMQPHHARCLEKAHESLLRKRQIPVMPPSLASGLRKLKSDGTGQCLYLVRYCSQTPRKFACFVLPAWDGRRYLPRSTKGMFVYFYFYFRSQGKPVSTVVPPCYVSGSSSELRSPTDNNNSTTTQLGFPRCKYLYVGALFWGRRSP